MSSSPARRRRLAMARAYPQARCPHCGSSLARVVSPYTHLERCEAAASTAIASAPEPSIARPSLLRRAVGRFIPQRGAAG